MKSKTVLQMRAAADALKRAAVHVTNGDAPYGVLDRIEMSFEARSLMRRALRDEGMNLYSADGGPAAAATLQDARAALVEEAAVLAEQIWA